MRQREKGKKRSGLVVALACGLSRPSNERRGRAHGPGEVGPGMP